MGISEEGAPSAADPAYERPSRLSLEQAASELGGFAVFGALADPTRRRMLELLLDARRATATSLAGDLPVSRQAVIKHLRVLEAAGLVSAARSGREVLYVASVSQLDASARWLAGLAASWDLGETSKGSEASEVDHDAGE
jgi:DNA-binding transcriptional ArsR family regulator